MNMAVIFAVAGIVVLAVLYFLARGQAEAVRGLGQLERRTEAIDSDAFANLVGENDRRFLEASLSGSELRKVKRLRARAALQYVGRIRRNAAVLLRLGEAGRESPDPQVAEAARELAALALRVRLNALQASARLCLELLFPFGTQPSREILGRYRSLTDAARRLGRLQEPALASRISSGL